MKDKNSLVLLIERTNLWSLSAGEKIKQTRAKFSCAINANCSIRYLNWIEKKNYQITIQTNKIYVFKYVFFGVISMNILRGPFRSRTIRDAFYDTYECIPRAFTSRLLAFIDLYSCDDLSFTCPYTMSWIE